MLVGTRLRSNLGVSPATLLRTGCVLVLLGILVAGLWPFHAPKNGVIWAEKGGGLLFGRHGSIVTAHPLKVDRPENTPSSLEIWLEPVAANKAGTILAVYQPDNFAILLALRQSLGDLAIEREDRKHQRHVKASRIYADDVFQGNNPILLTITSGASGTAVYSDARLAKYAPNLNFFSQDLAGQLIIGNAPSTTDSWSGRVRELILYDRELSLTEIEQHYANLTEQGKRVFFDAGHPLAEYLFNEGSGSTAHNYVDPTTDLLIPEYFVVPHKQFLELPWNEYHGGRSYWEDVIVNVAGFFPLGFFFCVLFCSFQKVRRPILLTIALGFAVSLTIEVLQGFLPTRDSGVNDIITNTTGAALGALAYSARAAQHIVQAVQRRIA